MILPRNVEKEEEFLNVALGNVSFSQHGHVSYQQCIFHVLGETKCFVTTADFAVPCPCVPTSMGHISGNPQTKI